VGKTNRELVIEKIKESKLKPWTKRKAISGLLDIEDCCLDYEDNDTNICALFVWEKTKQGREFWNRVYTSMQEDKP
jgi:hypothetical protein